MHGGHQPTPPYIHINPPPHTLTGNKHHFCQLLSTMGRQEGSDPLALHSSIALLQERFRQLQRIKEMREERELLRVLTKAEGTGQPARCEPFFHPDLILPSRPLHGSLTHRPQHLLQHEDYRHMEMLKLTRLWPDRATIRSTNNTQDDTDVDTSLHL